MRKVSSTGSGKDAMRAAAAVPGVKQEAIDRVLVVHVLEQGD
jgi:hypothetical protein